MMRINIEQEGTTTIRKRLFSPGKFDDKMQGGLNLRFSTIIFFILREKFCW